MGCNKCMGKHFMLRLINVERGLEDSQHSLHIQSDHECLHVHYYICSTRV